MSFETDKTINVGSRKSELAMIQTKRVVEQLSDLNSAKQYKIVPMSTIGDQILDKPLPKIGEKSLFTKELERALECGAVDFVVHSLKDMPTDLPDGMAIGAILQREDPRDVVILNVKHRGKTLGTLPNGSVIGTSSLRRTAQLSRTYPDLSVSDIRGNLNTRLRKLDQDDKYSAIILAKAGVMRLGWDDKIDQVLDTSEMLYAVGQGALAVECRENDLTTLALLESLHHKPTVARVVAERSFLNTLGGGCSAPVAVSSSLNGRQLTLTGAVWSLDGKKMIKHTSSCRLRTDLNAEDGEPPSKCPYREPRLFCGIAPGGVSPSDLFLAEKLGVDLASVLIKQDALEIMTAAKKAIHAAAS